MAIVNMSKFSVICLNSQKTHFLKDLMELGVAEINAQDDKMTDDSIPEGTFISNNSAEVSRLDAKIASLDSTLEVLEKYDERKKALFKTRKEITAEEFQNKVDSYEKDVDGIIESTSSAIKRIADYKNEINKLELLIKGLEPWKELDVPLNKTETKNSYIFMGMVPIKSNISSVLNQVLEKAPSSVIQQIGSDKIQIYLFIICLKAEKLDALEALREFGFTLVSLEENKGTAAESIDAYKKRIEVLKEQIPADEKLLAGYSARIPDIECVYDDILIRRDRAKAVGDMINTKKVFSMDGWIPTDKTDEISKLFNKYECYYEISESIKSEETPILLKNNKFATPFEAVTEMYSLPLATEVDPTPLLAPFYFIFFGMMLSDAAYGIILALGCFIVMKKFKLEGIMKKMISLFFLCGISTFFWGAIFGGWFGDFIPVFTKTFLGKEIVLNPIWFDPLQEPMKLLIFSLILGAIHLFVGMGVQGYMLIKDGKPWDALFDIGLWYLLLIGLVLFGIGGSLTQVVSSIGKWMSIVGAIGIVFTGGRNKKGFGKITGGLGSLYGVTGYLSDVLSYSRLLGLGLATGVVAKVVNILGSLAGNGIVGFVIFLIVFLIGNVFNIAINALGAYVHSCRLQYVEFLGKFYTGGGKPYNPFIGKTKFVKIVYKEEK